MDAEKKEEFEQVFDEATSEAGSASGTEAEAEANGEAEENKEEDQPTQETETGEQDGEETGGEETGTAEQSGTEDQGGKEEKTEEEKEAEAKADKGPIPPEKLMQQYKSLQGMFNSERKKREELERKLSEKAEGFGESGKETNADDDTAGSRKPETKAADKLVPYDQNEKIKAFKGDYPEVAEGIEEVVKYQKAEFETAIIALARHIAPFLKGSAEAQESKRESAVINAHQDFVTLRDSGSLTQWIEEQPAFKRRAYAEAWNSGSAEEMIELVKDYKQAMGITSGTPEKDESGDDAAAQERERKLRNMEGVKTKRPPVGGKGPAAKDDYVGAFNEALRT